MKVVFDNNNILDLRSNDRGALNYSTKKNNSLLYDDLYTYDSRRL